MFFHELVAYLLVVLVAAIFCAVMFEFAMYFAPPWVVGMAFGVWNASLIYYRKGTIYGQ